MPSLFLFLFGLIIGSFVNVIIYRLPRDRTFIKGRSQCPGCGGKIAWYDLIPVLSFIFLRARCRNCGFKISWSYPAIEIYSGIIFVSSFFVFGKAGLLNWLFSVFILEALLILAVIDLQHLILPDFIMLFMFIVALAYGWLVRFVFKSGAANIFSLDNLTAALLAFTVFFLVWFGSRGRWVGFGDAKLAGLLGFIFGGLGIAVILYLAIVLGAITGFILLALKKANLKTQLPLGSFIGFSASAYILCGPLIIERLQAIFRFVIPLFKVYN